MQCKLFHELYFGLVCIPKFKVQVKLSQLTKIRVSTLVKIFLCYSGVSHEIRDYSTEKSFLWINRTVL